MIPLTLRKTFGAIVLLQMREQIPRVPRRLDKPVLFARLHYYRSSRWIYCAKQLLQPIEERPIVRLPKHPLDVNEKFP